MKLYRNIKNGALLSVKDSINITGTDWELDSIEKNPEKGSEENEETQAEQAAPEAEKNQEPEAPKKAKKK